MTIFNTNAKEFVPYVCDLAKYLRANYKSEKLINFLNGNQDNEM